MKLPSVLTVAGSDSSGGAGIQADLKTIAALGLYGQSAVTALTAQNTCGVRSVHEAPPDFVRDQIDAVFEDIRPDAVKVGMLSSAQIASCVARALREHRAAHVVVDPVMVATSGAALMSGGTAQAMVGELFPLAQLVTPNLPEASALAGVDAAAQGVESMVRAARLISEMTPAAVLVKGGHLEGADCATDVLLVPGEPAPLVLRGRAVETAGTHGTGCTLSSAVACYLALGFSVQEAVRRAKAYLARCLEAGLVLGAKNGPLDHMAPLRASMPAPGASGLALAVPGPAGAAAGLQPPTPPDSPMSVGACSAAAPDAGAHGSAASPSNAPAGPFALLVGGSPQAPSCELLARLAAGARLVVACDSGADACMRSGVHVDVLVGDGDSMSAQALEYVRAGGARELDFPMDKDDTDLGLALGWLERNAPTRGVPEVVAAGFLGGRLDHELGVLGLFCRCGLPARLIEDPCTVHVLSARARRAVTFGAEDVGRTVSVAALPGPACVSESGMRWNLERSYLDCLDDLGISNVVECEGACVEVHEGSALVIVERDRIAKGSVL